MSKTLLYRLFKIGKTSDRAMHQAQKEGVILHVEGISGSVTFIDFLAPGKSYNRKCNWFSGSIVLTQQHLMAFKYTKPVIGLPWDDDRTRQLNCFLEGEDKLCIAFDAASFNDKWSGDIEVRYTTPMAQSLLENIEQNIARYGES